MQQSKGPAACEQGSYHNFLPRSGQSFRSRSPMGSWTEKFYDTIHTPTLARKSKEMGYPVICLSLGMMTHLAIRFLTAEMGVSDPIIPQRSILAGCGQSVA
eukprot:3333743-Pyramimonas_sp.AAC.1